VSKDVVGELNTGRTRLETEALVLGYAMSRLDESYLSGRGLQGWQQAFHEAAAALSEPPASFKNLRDEFDPVHSNPRKGWRHRPLRPTRLRVIDELQEVSDDALLELVARILGRDEEAVAEAVDALAVVTRIPHNVAERLLTGRRAEEFFLENAKRLTQIEPADMVDCRQQACGFDFGVRGEPRLAFEVKGLKPLRGGIQFTGREWREAKIRRDDYRLVVVGNLAAEPVAQVFPDPYGTLKASCTLQTSVTAIWRSVVSVSL
jgi:hypothetical protein